MSKRNKLQKFAEVLEMPNVYENFNHKEPVLIGTGGKEFDLKGKWREAHFKNDNPIILELACGRGEYTVHMGRVHPSINYIGVDIKGARIWKGARMALQEGLHNVAFLRTRIEQIALFFAPNEVQEIWITFPDPFLGKPRRRLTYARFLKSYQTFLAAEGIIHLKTDDPALYEFSVESVDEFPGATILYKDEDIYAKPLITPELEIKTYYEKMHLAAGKTIKYLKFTLPPKQ